DPPFGVAVAQLAFVRPMTCAVNITLLALSACVFSSCVTCFLSLDDARPQRELPGDADEAKLSCTLRTSGWSHSFFWYSWPGAANSRLSPHAADGQRDWRDGFAGES